MKLTPVAVDDNEYVIFGVRNCDAASLKVMDNIFLREPVDTYYKAHRDRGIIVTSACNNPEETCFCTAFEMTHRSFSSFRCCYLGKGDYLY